MLSSSSARSVSLSKIVRDDPSFSLEFDNVDAAFRDYKTAIAETIETNLSLLDEIPLPKHLSLDEVRGFFRKDIDTDLRKDQLFEKAVEVGRYAKNMSKSMDAYFREIFDLHEKRKERLRQEMFEISKMFISSDLPLSFLKTIEDSILAERDYLDIFDKEIRKERRDLIAYRNNRTKFERVCDIHNLWVKQFNEKQKDVEHERVRMIWYVDLNNSASVNEIFKDKIIKTSLLDKKILLDYTSRLQKRVHETETQNASKTEFRPFLLYEASDEARAMLEIMQIIKP